MNEFDMTGQLLMDSRYVDSARLKAQSPQDFQSLMFPTRFGPEETRLEHGCLAVIQVRGSLYQKGWNSYEWIERDFQRALEDPKVKGIVFDIHSPGGVVSGCYDLTDLIYEAREQKPTLALSNELAASAAYCLASACHEIVVTRTADVGSIGVLMVHWDISGALEKWGERVTMIHAGAHKTDRNPYEPLPADVRGRMQDSVMKTYDLFLSTVSRDRGLSIDEVQATEALCFSGVDAVEVGLADRVQSARDAMADFANKVKPNTGGSFSMKIKASELKAKLEAQGVTEEGLSSLGIDFSQGDQEVDVDDESAQLPREEQSAAPSASDDGDQKSRIKAITTSEHAKGRETLAQHLAFETDMSADAAEKMLQAAPQQSAVDPLTAAMGGVDQPNITGDGDDDLEPAQKVSNSWVMAFKQSGATVRKDT